jgi:hypothetical protein
MNKFEKLIEYIINDEDDKARQLFHTIVVEKSRDIYEGIMAEEMEEEGVHGYPTEDLSKELEAVDSEESMHEEEEEEGDDDGLPPEDDGAEDGDDTEFNLDGADDDGDLSGEMGSDAEHDDIEQHVMSANDKLDELLAKFDQIIGGGEPGMEEPGMEEPGMEEPGMEEPMDEMFMEADEEEEKEEEEEEESKKVDESKKAEKASEKKMTKAEKPEDGKANMKNKSNAKDPKKGDKPFESRQRSVSELMREYVEKIEDINLTPSSYSEGTPVGANTGAKDKSKVNTKAISLDKGPNFGGESVDFSGENENPDNKAIPKPSNEYNKGQGDLPGAGKFKNAPGNKKVWDGGSDKGHGAEKKSGSEGTNAGAKNTVGTKVNKKSELGQAGQPTGKKI